MSEFINEDNDNLDEQLFSDEDIQAVLGAGRTRGIYTMELENFTASNQKMAKVDLTKPLFLGQDGKPKDIANVKQGFENAKNSTKGRDNGWDKTIVVKRVTKEDGDNLYLVNTSLLKPAAS